MFRPAAFLARMHLRRRFGSVLTIMLVVIVTAGVSLALIAGSRRSASVVDRYFGRSTPYHLSVYAPTLSRERVQSLPHVVRADPSSYLAMVPIEASGKTSTTTGINGQGVDITALDDTFVFTDGGPPPPGDMWAVAVNPAFVEEFGKGVGDEVPVQMFAPDDNKLDAVAAGIYKPSGPKYTFHITGVVRSPVDIATDEIHPVRATTGYATDNAMLVPTEFYDRHQQDFWGFGQGFWIQLDDPRNRDAFLAALDRAAVVPGSPDSTPVIEDPPFSGKRNSFETPVDLETNALLALGLALALAGATVIGFMLRADQRRYSHEDPTLLALGATRAELGLTAMLRTAIIAIGGAIGAVVLAWSLSSRFPIGVGRMLELDPGMQINLAALLTGAVAIAVFVTACAYGFASRSSTRRPSVRHRGRFTPWLARSGAPNDVVLGSHLAFGRSSQTGASTTRAAIVGGAIALTVVIGTGIFVNGVDDLYSRPAAHGWSWDLAIGNVNFDIPDPIVDELRADPRLQQQTFGRYGQAMVGGHPEEVLAFDAAGTAPPEVLSGRLPKTASEIALGPQLRKKLGVRVGDTVPFTVADGEFDEGEENIPTMQMTFVGEALTPLFGQSELASTAMVTLDAIEASRVSTKPQLTFVRLNGDKAEQIAALRRDYTPEMETDTVPARVVNLHKVRALPLIGALLAAFLGTVLLAYTLIVTARARTRELGVLRALGLSARSTGRVLMCQGVMLALAIAAVGVPAGLLVGTYAWRIRTVDLGVAQHTIYGLWIPLLLVVVALVGIVCSWLPARRARKATVATVLRSE